jgi:hypothetical protein
MKKKKSDPPHDFEVEDADAAFGKLEDAPRKLLVAKKPEAKATRKTTTRRSKTLKR